MASVRGEFILLGGGATAYAGNMIREVIGTFTLEVTGSATASGQRPIVPNTYPDGEIYCRLTAIDEPVYVAWGANPTASGALAANELRLSSELPDAIAVKGGNRLSFITGT